MSYIGRAPGFGIRNRYLYTATAAQTTFSGADDNGQTLAYADSKYLDVYLNGVLLVAGTDYTATTLTSVVLTTGASASDILEVIAYDVFSVADTVSSANGGTFNGAVTFADGVVVSGGTGDNTLSIPDNLASAFDITESTNSYLKFVTTDSSEAIVAGKTLQTALVEPTTDDSSDLGTSSKRFQDLYLSGGVYVGGTGAANYLTDYEYGTWTPVLSSVGGDLTATYNGTLAGEYVKIGRFVFCSFALYASSISGGSGNFHLGGLPFTSSNSGVNRSGGPVLYNDGIISKTSYTSTFNVSQNVAYAIIRVQTGTNINNIDGVVLASDVQSGGGNLQGSFSYITS